MANTESGQAWVRVPSEYDSPGTALQLVVGTAGQVTRNAGYVVRNRGRIPVVVRMGDNTGTTGFTDWQTIPPQESANFFVSDGDVATADEIVLEFYRKSAPMWVSVRSDADPANAPQYIGVLEIERNA